MKTIEELKSKLAETQAEQEKLWDIYQAEEKKRMEAVKNVDDPFEVAKLAWIGKYREVQAITAAIKYLEAK